MESEIKKRKLALLTDYYELLMMQGFMKNNKQDLYAVFDVYYRYNPYGNGFCVFSGLGEIVDYVMNLKFEEEDILYLKSLGVFNDKFLDYLRDFKFTGSIYSFYEGSIINKKEPIIKVVAPIMQAQLLESAILSIFNHETLIATKAYRICTAADNKPVMEFGLRRAHNFDSGIYGAKAAIIGGCIGTSNVLTSKMENVHPMGTQAHAWIMSFDDEYTAFYEFAKLYPNMAILLVDTYDVLRSGMVNAIKAFKKLKEEGVKLTKYGVRIDSGDLAYLSKEARKMLDKEGFTDAVICASNDLDERLIQSLRLQGAKIDMYGVGTKLITGGDYSSLGGVYKMSAMGNINHLEPKIKISENSEKITNPGNKEVMRIYDENKKIVADYICLEEEQINVDEDLYLFDPDNIWKKKILKKKTYYIEKMLKPIIINGKLVYNDTTLLEKQKFLKQQLEYFNDDHKRLINPKEYHINLSKNLYDLKNKMINEHMGK